MPKRIAYAMRVAAVALCCAIASHLPAPTIAHAADSTTSPDSLLVKTQDGPVQGMVRDGVRQFLGIPYAAPPVGNLRWKAPQPHPAWTATLDATHFGDACAQIFPFGRGGANSEDCLSLNIYAPDPAMSGVPVMVWIHGGSFLQGTGATYDGNALAGKGRMVVVTINYRLGPLGFLALKALDAENPDHVSGDYGVMDQQAALRWVQRNISAFGGDPNKVTAAGESAGAISVCLQLVSPASAGLFQRAILESGPCLRPRPLAEAETHGQDFAAKLGCTADVPACLRSKTIGEVLNALPGDALSGPPIWNPVVDGHLIPKQPAEAFQSGNFNKVSFINGSNHDEGTLFLWFSEPMTADQYASSIQARLGPDAARVRAAYPLSNYASPLPATAAIFGDSVFSCSVRKASQLLSAQVPTYEYEFNDRNAPNIFTPHPPYPMGAYHASEIQYVFQSKPRARWSQPLAGEQLKLSDQMMRYWTSFIASGDPDGTAPKWTPYQASEDKILSLAPGAVSYESDFAKQHHCEIWDSITSH
ncbi:MAG: carboxylesterase/lipase family protein [Candidatus Binataceae bacterium]